MTYILSFPTPAKVSYCHCSVWLQRSQSLRDQRLDCNPNQAHAMTSQEDVSAHKMLLVLEVMSQASKVPYLHSKSTTEKEQLNR